MLEVSGDAGRANFQRCERFGHPLSGCPKSLFRSGATSASEQPSGYSQAEARCLSQAAVLDGLIRF